MIKNLLRIAVTGASGRMGRLVIKEVVNSKQVVLGAVIDKVGSSWIGVDVGVLIGVNNLNIFVSDNLNNIKNDFDILIDFTHPLASLMYLDCCLLYDKKIVIGTTGFDILQIKNIKRVALKIGIVFSANFSIGVNLMIKLLEKTTKVMGDRVDIEIIESHHRHKIDAPSGTALTMGEVIANSLGLTLSECAIYNRKDYVGKRKEKSIGFSTIRAGDTVGEHTVMFADFGERLEITHKASNRSIFAKGAIQAAIWLAKKDYGMYNMEDVLNLTNI